MHFALKPLYLLSLVPVLASAMAAPVAPLPQPIALQTGSGSGKEAVNWPTSGSLILDFQLDTSIYPTGASGSDAAARDVALLESPLFKARIVNKRSIVELALSIQRKAPLPPMEGNFAKVMWSHLKGGQPYQLGFVWDTASHRFDVYLNGTLQEVSSAITVPYWEDGLPELSGVWQVASATKLGRLFDAPLSDEAIAQMARRGSVPSLAGEGRTLYTEALEIDNEGLELLYAADFSKPLDLTLEKNLFENDIRIRKPDTEWVLEGDGTAISENGSVKLETNQFTPPSRWEDGEPVWERPAHLNLFLNRRMPDRILIEYDLEVWDPHHGLHILFFSATHPNGGSIFQPGLSFRDGDFRKNILNPEEFLSYHISFWAAPYDIIRRSSNLRKNGKFILQAVGDDRIVHEGKGPHRIRVLKDGPRIAAEVNGVKIIDFMDDPEIFGALYKDGYLGLRMMGFAKWIKISDFRVYALPQRDATAPPSLPSPSSF